MNQMKKYDADIIDQDPALGMSGIQVSTLVFILLKQTYECYAAEYLYLRRSCIDAIVKRVFTFPCQDCLQ